jgi:TolB protein
MTKRIRTLLATFLVPALCGLSPVALGQLTIEIIGGGGTTIPIAIVPFNAENTYPQGITSVVGADLARSGLFRLVDPASVTPRPTQPGEVRYPDWRAKGADALLVGSMQPASGGRVEVRYHLLDVAGQSLLHEMTYTVTPQQFRATAHRIADEIYEKLTGDRGVFSTRIAYVAREGSQYSLVIADSDGENAVRAVRSPEPLLSPSWSPDGARIAYVSMENRKPVIYMQTLATGRRDTLANFKGSNSAPAWSPDGRRLAVTLTKDGISQIYLINVDGQSAERLTTSTAIDTEPNFSPDGRTILFTSDRGGSPQIYRLNLANRNVERMTFEGSYNVSPRHSPDGKGFSYVRREGGRFVVVIQDFASRQTQVLTQGPLDESPSFAPNGRMILHAASAGGRGILAAVSSDGRVKQRLTSAVGDVREPAWAPFPR